VEASAFPAPHAHRLRISISAPLLRLRSDEQLVALFRAGNEDAFRTIHDRYRARLYAYVRQMLGGSQSDAEDALQDVFLRAYGALRSNEREIALRAWLYRVAHNRCIDHLRRPIPPAADVFDVSRRPAADPSTATERREDLRRLVEDVRRLPEQQRSVLLMREMDGLSYADLADALDVSVPAVKSLLVRARMGLVQAAEARDIACFEVRKDLAAAHGRGVRANGRARRHLRDCAGCRAYRRELRGRQKALAGLSPVAGAGPLSLLAQLVGGSGAAGGGAVAGGSAVVGGSAVAATATKLAIVVGAAVVTAGGAVEVRSQLDRMTHVSVAPSYVAVTAPPHRATARSSSAARVAAPARAIAAAAGTAPNGPAVQRNPYQPNILQNGAADPTAASPAVPPAPTDPGAAGAPPPAPAATSPTAVPPAPHDVQSAIDSIPKVLPPPPSPPPAAASTPAPPAPAPTSTPSSGGTQSTPTTQTTQTTQAATSSGSTDSGPTASAASASPETRTDVDSTSGG
jgi:RNA polymerase sigma factor (sigma-70 family)